MLLQLTNEFIRFLVHLKTIGKFRKTKNTFARIITRNNDYAMTKKI